MKHMHPLHDLSDILHRRRRHGQKVRRHAPGTEPGMISVDTEALPAEVRVIAYSPETVVEKTVENPAEGLEEVKETLASFPVTWVEVTGLGSEDVLRGLAELFGLHQLALEDVVNIGQRSKAEEYAEHYFVVLQMAHGAAPLDLEQVSLFVGEGFVLSFQERAGDKFEPVRERIRQGRGKLRGMGSDYLAYALIDAMIDGYFPVIEAIGDRLEALEDLIITEPQTQIIGELHAVRRELLTLRRTIWPQRDVVNALQRGAGPFKETTQLYLRDCYDHVLRLMELAENLREMGANLMDLHLSMVSHRMNEVMKVLTIISTIFIPLGFLAGLYGMNFNPAASPWNMPELSWYWGYPTILGVMLAVVVGLMFFFRSKGWLGGSD